MKNAVFGWLRIALAALMLSLAAPQTASADIRAFNAAVGRKDYAEAAAEAERTWPTLDKTRTDIAVIAREFATMAMLARQPQKAKIYASFLVNGAASRPAPDDAPELSRVLLTWADLEIRDTQSNRRALIAALQARIAKPGSDLISLLASGKASTAAFKANDWDDARAATNAALEISRRGGRSLLARQRNFELALIAVEYVDSRRRGRAAYTKVVDFDEQVFADAQDPANAGIAGDLWVVHDYAWAWRYAMQAYFQSDGTPNVEPREVRHDEDIQHRTITQAPNPPFCYLRRAQRNPGIRYPESTVFQGSVGAVIVDMGVDDQMRAVNPRVVAAVPSETFNEAVLTAARNWTFEVVTEPTAPGPGCRVARDHYQVVVTFAIGG
jgi:hypothetical protein